MDTSPTADLLIVDDDIEVRESISDWFARRGYRVSQAGSAEDALVQCQRQVFDVGLFDLRMPGMSGLELLERMKEISGETEVVLLTGVGTVETAVAAMRLGAYDYVVKPCPFVELELRCRKAYEARRLRRENRRLKALVERSRPKSEMIGRSPAMQRLFRLIERVAPTDVPVLIQGESGTGKELVARTLQRQSRRADRPFVVVNCAALPEPLLESELFGHEKGAFTGAVASKPGLFEIADGGTLFIDEIGELAPGLRAKLLRALEDGTFRRVGSVKDRRADVRILAATNRNLAAEVAAGRFREDLYYRLNVMLVELPPLRERPDDIPPLVDALLGPGWEVNAGAMECLCRYRWPGNVRQLLNALERAKILSKDRLILVDDLPPEVTAAGVPTATNGSSPGARESEETSSAERLPAERQPVELATVERIHVMDVLRRERGNKARAARMLGINRRRLYRLLERYELQDTGRRLSDG
jgi:DNA-binding NtrC family response regulator